MRFETLEAWLRWQEGLHHKEIELGLERVREVASRLGLLKPEASVISVAGTNGKGSTVAMLDAIYRSAGYRVGLYTSPHILKYNERVRIQGESADDAALCAAFEAIDQARGDISLSYFEFGTLAALWLFADAGLDLILLEVGLGGRLDAVNIIDADLALITALDVDHSDWLGNDREQIGVEKAGIMRQGRPAVLSDPAPPQSVMDEAQRIGSDLSRLGRDFRYQKTAQLWTWEAGPRCYAALPLPGLRGDFQLQNAAGVIAAIEALQAVLPVEPEAIAKGLEKASCPGRLMQVGKDPMILLDVAHNPQGTRALAEYLANHPIAGQDMAVVGVMADKDVNGLLEPLIGVFHSWYLASPAIARAMDVDELFEALHGLSGQIRSRAYTNVAEALSAACQGAGREDRVVVFGSFYTVAEAMAEAV